MSLLPTTDIIHDRLRLVIKHVKEAQELDVADRPIESYVKYLSCMQSIVQTLLDDATGGESWVLKAKARESYLKVMNSSLSRVEANIEVAYSKKAIMNNTVPHVTTPGIMKECIFPPPEVPRSDSQSSPDKLAHHCCLKGTFSRHSGRKMTYDPVREKVAFILLILRLHPV